MTSELKPCPFCGAKAKFKGGRLSQESVTIWCENLHLSGGFTTKEAAAADWNTRAVPDVAELVRLAWSMGGLYQCETGFYTDYGKATEVIAAEQQKTQDAEELAFRMDRFATKYLRHKRNAEQRAEAAEAKLAQYEAQEPVMWLCVHDDRGSDRVITTSFPSRKDILKADGYEITPLYSAPLTPEGGKEC